MTAADWVDRFGIPAALRSDADAVVAQIARSHLFAAGEPITIARAPARLDVIGGIADYSGALVLEWPLADATFVAVQRCRDPSLTVVSGSRRATVSCSLLLGFTYEAARSHFSADPATHWLAYVAGALLVLARDHGAIAPDGARILIASTIPEGKGLSSSAALEVASMTAFCGECGVDLEPRQLALACQRVENLIAGAPCGVMDQMTVACGAAGRLLALLCQPAEVQGCLELPDGLALWGIDSGIRHAVSDADYSSVRTAAFMGRSLLEKLVGRPVEYLANVTPEEFAPLAARLPERLSGRQLLEGRCRPDDVLTTVDPERTYPVRSATAHPVFEHARACEFSQRLSRIGDDGAAASRFAENAAALGALMYESHDSYSACGLGSEGTDALVSLVRRAGPGSGLYGAKVTGGGRGGTVAILGRSDAGGAVGDIAAQYARESGRAARVISGSSAGAAACGAYVVQP